MKILAHRGYWLRPEEKNSLAAFDRARVHGFGLETDVRDLRGRLVISHDPPAGGEPMLERLLAMYRGSDLVLAINIKADGLSAPLQGALDAAGVRWFAFDMSGPETMRYLQRGAPTFTRHSDVEPAPIFYSEAQGVWLDGMRGDWFTPDVIDAHLERGKQVCVVSPELHGRDPEHVWAWLATTRYAQCDALYVCTDRPEHLLQRVRMHEEELS